MRPTSWILAALIALAGACSIGPEGSLDPDPGGANDPSEDGRPGATAYVDRPARYRVIRDAAGARGVRNAYLFAGIANTETNLAHCWAEATWACKGPASPDCGGGPVIAGASDGPCSIQEGGLGMFQFDAGRFSDTLAAYGNSVLTVDGQIGHAINYVTNMVKISAYTTNAETDSKARAWINNFDPNNATLRDQWIKTVLRYYNGCQPQWSCWQPRYKTYSDGLSAAINEVGGLGFWGASIGTSCNGSPSTIGEIDKKYRALGGCGSFLGAPITPEQTPPDGIGRYSVFQNGSIYWSPSTGAHEVHGRIRDAYRDLGWEAGQLGYPTSDEYAVAEGRRSDFEHGSIIWNSQTDATRVETSP